MDDLSANIGKLFLFLFILLILFDVILVRWLKISKRWWKKLEYVWLFLAALGLISASAQVRIWLANDQINSVHKRAVMQYERLRQYLGGVEPPAYICMKFNRTWLSPENFDEVQKEYDELCNWNKNLLSKLPTYIPDELPSFEYDEYKPLYVPENDISKDYLKTVKMYFEDYQKTRNEYFNLKTASVKNGIEELFTYLTPILLCFALALRITKVTGELRTET